MQLPPWPAGLRLCPKALGQSRREGLQCARNCPAPFACWKNDLQVLWDQRGCCVQESASGGTVLGWVAPPPPPPPPVCAPTGPHRSKAAGRLPPDPKSFPARPTG